MGHMRNARHLNFNRDSDLLLDFFRGSARPLRDHLNIVIGYVRIRLHGKVVEGDNPPCKKKDGGAEHKPAVVESEIDQPTNHYCSAEFCSSRAFDTTCCPTFSPEVTSCIFPGSMLPPCTPRRRNLP